MGNDTLINTQVGFQNNIGNTPLMGWVTPSFQQITFAHGITLPLLPFLFRQLAYMYSGSKNCPNVWLFQKEWSVTNQINYIQI